MDASGCFTDWEARRCELEKAHLRACLENAELKKQLEEATRQLAHARAHQPDCARCSGNRQSSQAMVGMDVSKLSVVASSTDPTITELVRTACKVNSLEKVIDAAKLGIWDLNSSTHELVTNNHWYEMLGHEEGELESEDNSWKKLVHPEDYKVSIKKYQEHVQCRMPEAVSLHRMAHKNGHWVWVLSSIKITERDEQNKPLHACGINQDFNHIKALEAELKKALGGAQAAVKAKGAFLANMSHEIRTPMAGILGAGGLLLDAPLNAHQAELATMMVHSTRLLLSTVNNILDLSKIEEGCLKTECIPVDFDEVMATADELFRPRARAKGIALEVANRCPPQCWMLSDPTRLRQILYNLLGNAIKFTKEGKVTVEASLEPPHAPNDAAVENGCAAGPSLATGDATCTPNNNNSRPQTKDATGTPGRQMPAPDYPASSLHGSMPPPANTMAAANASMPPPEAASTATRPRRNAEDGAAAADPSQPNADNARAATDPTNPKPEDGNGAADPSRPPPGHGSTWLAPQAQRSPPWRLSLRVSDTGIGMSTEMLAHVFDRFLQADASVTRMYGGSGLGTTISKKLTTLMGGDVAVASEEGKGSVFTVKLPVRLTPPPCLGIKDGDDEGIARNYGLTAILAEDNPLNRRILDRVLSSLGIATVPACDGLAVLDRVADTPHHDLILMDIQMPRCDGVTATRALRSKGYTRPIVALTANVTESDAQSYLAAGMNGALPKPFTKALICAEIDRLARAGLLSNAGEGPGAAGDARQACTLHQMDVAGGPSTSQSPPIAKRVCVRGSTPVSTERRRAYREVDDALVEDE